MEPIRIVDTFLFAEAYEKELLLIKLVLEYPLIEKFVLVESTHTFRGDFKGLQARKMVEEDERFAPYRDKIHYVEHQGRLHEGPPGYQTYYENEEKSRQSAWPYIQENFSDDCWVIISDVDEAVDCTDPARLELFQKYLRQYNGQFATLRFGHYRYWYDFDNRCYWTGIVTPVTQVAAIKKNKSSMRCRSVPARHQHDIAAGEYPLFFEYTFCFPHDAMWKKLNSFIHDGYTKRDLRNALATNHWVKSKARQERPTQAVDWLETVVLTEQNSPQYVRDNLAWLKTNIIPTNYRENRKKLYDK